MIKLDVSLIRDIDHDSTKRSLVRSLTAFGREVSAEVVAEGVESTGELATLERIGVDYVQGFLLGRPGAVLADATIPRPQHQSSAVAQAIDEKLFENIAAQLGLSPREVRVLSPTSLASLWRRVAFDGLTAALQRSFGIAALEREMARARRREEPLAVVFIDLDRLKAINDVFGHEAGDRVLHRFAALTTAQLRREDVLVRYGGDEFVCILPGTSARDAHLVVSRIRAATTRDKITFSAGTAQLLPGDSAATLLKRADEAMYADKRRARRRSG